MLEALALNNFARVFAAELLHEFPLWERFATVDPSVHVDAGSLLVEVPSPPDTPYRVLRISTHNGEVTISFGSFHTHRDWPCEEAEFANPHVNPLEFIRQIVADQLVAAYTERAGVPGWATVVEPSELRQFGAGVGVYSWSGRLDRLP